MTIIASLREGAAAAVSHYKAEAFAAYTEALQAHLQQLNKEILDLRYSLNDAHEQIRRVESRVDREVIARQPRTGPNPFTKAVPEDEIQPSFAPIKGMYVESRVDREAIARQPRTGPNPFTKATVEESYWDD